MKDKVKKLHYEKTNPADNLKHIIDSYWHVDSQGDSSIFTEKIIPDGYPEIIIHYGDPYRINISGHWELQEKYLLGGQLRNHFHLQNTGISGMVGIKLQPTTHSKLFGLNMSDLTDQVVPMPEEIHKMFLPLIENTDKSFAEIIEWLNEFFLTLLEEKQADANPSDLAVAEILRTNGLVSVKTLTSIANTGERQLERLFKQHLGLSPKFYSRIVRFAHIFQLIQQRDKQWLDLVYESGFYDQSHFIRNFKEFTGEEPSNYGFDKDDMANFHLMKK